MKNFGFKHCTSIDGLYEALKKFPEQMKKFAKKKKNKDAYREAYEKRWSDVSFEEGEFE